MLNNQRPKVKIRQDGKELTLKQFKKYTDKEIERDYLSKSQITGRKILNRSKLDNLIKEGKVETLYKGNKIFVRRSTLVKHL